MLISFAGCISNSKLDFEIHSSCCICLQGMSCVPDYMPSQPEISDKMRAVLINWLIEVSDLVVISHAHWKQLLGQVIMEIFIFFKSTLAPEFVGTLQVWVDARDFVSYHKSS
jgi:hypothetical protein